jgi:hypothetical protein
MNLLLFSVSFVFVISLFVILLIVISVSFIYLGNYVPIKGKRNKNLSSNKILNIIRAIETSDGINEEEELLIKFYLNRKLKRKKFRYTVKRA